MPESPLPDARFEALVNIQTRLCEIEKPIRILRSLAWPASVREAFFKKQAQVLPEVDYVAFDAKQSCDALADLKKTVINQLGTSNTLSEWLCRQVETVKQGALLLAAIAKPQFLEHSTALYGQPSGLLPDGKTTVLSLAADFNNVLEQLDGLHLGLEVERVSAEGLVEKMRVAVTERFGKSAPAIELVDELSANALAGPRRIRIRRGASFSDKDIAALIQHEAYIHVATALNGRRQTYLPLLGRSHPGTTRTQEGLAVFAEFITGSMEPARLRRLTDRVTGIQMAIDNADFIEVYRFFLERNEGQKVQAFENTRRVFRGGVISGGAPFTKDIVYLEGLLRVHNFLRICVSEGRADLLRLLFCGKLDLEDIGALAELAEQGICQAPVFLPPWADDLRFLLSYLAYSSFLNSVHLDTLRQHYAQLTQGAPRIGRFLA